ncbi:MAG: hypothetical protein QOK40_2818, partial [Miltoncostaeaceae bacterium]|nr:hypothetical protein [Miltoncostaeaceae bacterium]
MEIVAGADGDPAMIDEDQRRRLLERAIAATPGAAEAIAGPLNLAEEIDAVIAGRGLSRLEDYLALERSGRGAALRADARQAVWGAYERYREELRRRGETDWRHLRLRALQLALAGHGRRYDAVIVDEAQDLTETGVLLLAALDQSPDLRNLMIVGDGQQSIYP